MKKIISAVLVFVGLTTATFAQTAPQAKKNHGAKVQLAQASTENKTETKVVKPATFTSTKHVSDTTHKKSNKKAEVKKATTAAPATAATTPSTAKAGVKKDGTPDMRYKANKDTTKFAKPAHVKKDGTADKRYKENKKA
jgi:cytoskeletal protein RodZ